MSVVELYCVGEWLGGRQEAGREDEEGTEGKRGESAEFLGSPHLVLHWSSFSAFSSTGSTSLTPCADKLLMTARAVSLAAALT